MCSRGERAICSGCINRWDDDLPAQPPGGAHGCGAAELGGAVSPLVNGDVNGDGVARNDRAFIFNPASFTTPTGVAQGMQTLLNEGGGIASCLRSQIGEIAGRNSCFGPWSTSLNWQLNIRPNMAGLDRPSRFRS